jgi:molecular chaperone DnaK
MILWRQDWFVIDRFNWLAKDSDLFPNPVEHSELVKVGKNALQANDVDKLREVVAQLDSIRVGVTGEDEMMTGSNILMG